MKVLLVHRYYWPDTPPYASMLRSMAEHLASDGHAVNVYTAQPSYGSTKEHDTQPRAETLTGEFGTISIRRARLVPESKRNVPARLVNLLLYATQVYSQVHRGDYDIVLVATTPPILVSTAATIAAKRSGAASVYHCQDIYPEVATATGVLKPGRFASLLRHLDTLTMKRADRVVVLSGDMASTAKARSAGISEKVRVINNFALEDFSTPDQPEAPKRSTFPSSLDRRDGISRVVFAGNLGNFQGLDSAIAAAALGAPSVEWIFLGKGQAEARLKAQALNAPGSAVRFLGHHSPEVAQRVVAEADLALVSLGPGVIEAAYPSKTLTYLAAGTPIVVVAEPSSELAMSVKENRLGASCSPDDPEALALIVSELLDEPCDLVSMRESCRAFALERTSREAQLQRWTNLLSEFSELSNA